MDFKDVELWLALYDQKNITKTAQRLYLSQPALTNRIKKVEDEFGTDLLIREHSGIEFTPNGRKFIQHCQILKNDYQALQADLLSTSDEIHGSLTIGVTSIFARFRLPDLLKKYLELNPQVNISVKTGRSWDVYPLLKNQETPVAILREGYAWNDGKQLLADEPLCLANLSKISFDERFSALPPVRMTASNIDTALAFVSAGLGWAILPKIVLKNFKGYVKPLRWQNGKDFTRSTWLCYYENSLRSPAVASFVSFIKENAVLL